jgi:hypothetical protein
MRSVLLALASGALTSAYIVIALFFAKFWRRTHDRLFVLFASAFALLAVQRVVLGVVREWAERSVPLYGLRLIAFLIIIVAIVDKNRAAAASDR